ncbi:hypothetical protein HMPREF9303_0240 [Prevotella denticola CRIS 18C-A]|uniref:Uncharacterized protein n=1 Tax=Prevotella denticola CRIS 18C-A TaxID=944557 RepID=F0H5F4_9BACT|nr:hypothetical protein HMPREF9303_0240 [Prevotella denticola CRIS 18C-A]
MCLLMTEMKRMPLFAGYLQVLCSRIVQNSEFLYNTLNYKNK